MLCRSRQVHFIIEQPLNSLFFQAAWLQDALSICGTSRHVTFAGGFGATSLKPLELHTSVPLSAMRLLIADCKSARARLAASKGGTAKLSMKTRRTSKGKHGERHWTTGVKNIKDLASQPANQAASQPTCLPACPPVCLIGSQPANLLASLPACSPAKQPASQPAAC